VHKSTSLKTNTTFAGHPVGHLLNATWKHQNIERRLTSLANEHNACWASSCIIDVTTRDTQTVQHIIIVLETQSSALPLFNCKCSVLSTEYSLEWKQTQPSECPSVAVEPQILGCFAYVEQRGQTSNQPLPRLAHQPWEETV